MIMAGGDVQDINNVMNILLEMGKVQITGPLGAGHAMKSLNNYVSAAGLIASFEALNAAKKIGIDPKNFVNIINWATGRNNTTEVKLDKFVISEQYNSGFALDLMVKDVSIADGLIKKLTNTNPLSDNVLSYLISSHEINKSLRENGFYSNILLTFLRFPLKVLQILKFKWLKI